MFLFVYSNSGPLSQALNGIDWTLARIRASGRRSVVNMSFGGPSSQALNNAVNRLTEAGAAVVVAAGNDSSDACNVSPANSRDALTVGASSQDDSYASYSNEVRHFFSHHDPHSILPSLF